MCAAVVWTELWSSDVGRAAGPAPALTTPTSPSRACGVVWRRLKIPVACCVVACAMRPLQLHHVRPQLRTPRAELSASVERRSSCCSRLNRRCDLLRGHVRLHLRTPTGSGQEEPTQSRNSEETVTARRTSKLRPSGAVQYACAPTGTSAGSRAYRVASMSSTRCASTSGLSERASARTAACLFEES